MQATHNPHLESNSIKKIHADWPNHGPCKALLVSGPESDEQPVKWSGNHRWQKETHGRR